MRPLQFGVYLLIISAMTMPTDDSAECLVQLLRQLRVPATRRGVYTELARHPHHPSLLAFSDVLRAWGVPNAAYRVDAADLSALPTPFVAHLATRGGEFQLIKQVDATQVAGVPLGTRPATCTIDEFNQAFTGSILLAETQPGAGEPYYQRNRREEIAERLQSILLLVGSLLLLCLVLTPAVRLATANWPLALLLAAKTSGLAVASLLLAQNLGHHNPLLQRLCGSGSTSGCHAILASPAARLSHEVSWAEVGFSYFAGTWLALLALPATPGPRLLLTILSLLSLPFTAYSLYYQGRVARQWCVLCCAVLILLWLETGVSVFALSTPRLLLPTLVEWATLLVCMLAPALAWLAIRPFLTRAQQADMLWQKLATFKRDQYLFESALAVQPHHELLPAAETLCLGHPQARHLLTVVTSPTCPPCAHTHSLLTQWLSRRPDDLRVQFVFAVPADPVNFAHQVAVHLLSLNKEHPAIAEIALHDWFTAPDRNSTIWADRYPVPSEGPVLNLLGRHHVWCQQAGIAATPTILLNGHILPASYHLEDVQYML